MARKKIPEGLPWNTCDCWQECQYADECNGVCKGYKNAIIPPTKEDNALRLLALKEQKQQLEDTLKGINSKIETVTDSIIQDMLTEEIDRFKAHDTFFYWRYDTFASVNRANKQGAMRWLQLNGHSKLVITDIDKKGLAKAVEGMLAVSDELPGGLDDLVSVYEKQTIRTRKSAKKGVQE